MGLEQYCQGGNAEYIGTRRTPVRLALAAYSTNASFTAIGTEQADVAEPAESASCAVIPMGDFNRIVITPTGTDADGETHARRVYGVRAVVSGSSIVGYQRKLLCTITCTNCAVAVNSAINGATANAYYCDTLVVAKYAIDPLGIIDTSNSSDVPASVQIDTTGYPIIEIRYAINGGTGVAMNDFYFKY